MDRRALIAPRSVRGSSDRQINRAVPSVVITWTGERFVATSKLRTVFSATISVSGTQLSYFRVYTGQSE